MHERPRENGTTQQSHSQPPVARAAAFQQAGYGPADVRRYKYLAGEPAATPVEIRLGNTHDLFLGRQKSAAKALLKRCSAHRQCRRLQNCVFFEIAEWHERFSTLPNVIFQAPWLRQPF